tara:strand:+ start:781 stop:1347 length:567 start_codon:yes stop_codon:yes gene_type:complete
MQHLNKRNNQKSVVSIEKDNRNHILAPPELQTEDAMVYTIAEEKEALKHSALVCIAKYMSDYDLIVYKKIGKVFKPNTQFKEIKTYFNSSAANHALAALLFQNYYHKLRQTKTQLAWHVGISRNSMSDKIDYCVKKDYVTKDKTKYSASPFFVRAYLDYAERSAGKMAELANKMTSYINVYNQLKNDN